MGEILEMVDSFVSEGRSIVLFYPSVAEYEKYAENADRNLAVVGSENVCGAEKFIELP